MKTIVPSGKTVKAIFFSVSLLTMFISGNSQMTSSAELVFNNPSVYSGTAGTDGVVYSFPSVNNDLDAFVKITGRSSALVSLSTIDLTSTGFQKAFQPQVKYDNGSVSAPTSWWMEFEISFVNKNTTTAATISSFNLTGLDIDGDNSTLQEQQTYFGGGAYTLESPTLLTVTNSVGTIAQPALAGKMFTGTSTDHPGIDTSDTQIMTTLSYVNTNKFTIRVGASTTSSSTLAERMYSLWFKTFNYNVPSLKSLPVTLLSFNAMLINHTDNVDLSWTTATEKNVSHFAVQKSVDGKNFTDAGIVLAYGNTTDQMNYKFTDNITGTSSKIIYYRLCTVDEDGKLDYSTTRIIRTAGQTDNSISLLTYPNPAVNELRVTIPNNWQNKKVTYEMFNNNGQVAKKSETANSSQTETLNVSAMSPGFYIVRVTCDGQTAQQKIIKN